MEPMIRYCRLVINRHRPVQVVPTEARLDRSPDARESGKRRLFAPLILATLCGLRRGEITALRWKSVDLNNGQIAVVASTEQTDAGNIREKEAKSGRARTVAMPAMAVEELRRWR
jgi:integrase